MTKPLQDLKPPTLQGKIDQLTDVGGWKLMMCRQVPFQWGVCDTPDGSINSGTEECNECRYNYDDDYIGGGEHDPTD